MHRTNVSSIHLCQRCPRLLGYQLSGYKNVWKIGLVGLNMPGKIFHEHIAAPFHKAMASGPKTPIYQTVKSLLDKPQEKLEIGLLVLLEEHFFLPTIQRYGKTLRSDQILQLGRGLELWSRYLSQFLSKICQDRHHDPETLLTQSFYKPETLLKGTYILEDGRKLQIAGKYDALLFDSVAGEAIVIEFKGLKAGHLDEDFLQLVLYCWLIKAATDVTPCGVIFYLEEEEPEVLYSAEDLQQAMQNLSNLLWQVVDVIEVAQKKSKTKLPSTPDPYLCKICPFDPNCDQDWGPRRGEMSMSSSQDSNDTTRETEQGLRALTQALDTLKLPVESAGYITGPRFIRYKIKPKLEQGVTVKKLVSQAENLQVALSLQTAPFIQPQAGYVSIDIPRKIRIPLTLREVWEKGQRNRPSSRVAFPIGMAIDGSVVWANLSDPTMTSILVGGTSRSGKSVFLRAATIGLALNAKPEAVQLTLIDPKRVNFTDLTALPHLSGPILMEPELAIGKLNELVDLMEERYRLFEKKKVPDINAYNQIARLLGHQVVIIDEYADLMLDKDTQLQLESTVRRLGQKGRAAGIHLILATQRPDARVVTPIIKANLQLRVAFKVTTAVNSNIILDTTGAEYLTGHGDLLIGGSVPLQRLQGPLVTKTEIEMAIRNQ